jgi:hypothetical protein
MYSSAGQLGKGEVPPALLVLNLPLPNNNYSAIWYERKSSAALPRASFDRQPVTTSQEQACSHDGPGCLEMH